MRVPPLLAPLPAPPSMLHIIYPSYLSVLPSFGASTSSTLAHPRIPTLPQPQPRPHRLRLLRLDPRRLRAPRWELLQSAAVSDGWTESAVAGMDGVGKIVTPDPRPLEGGVGGTGLQPVWMALMCRMMGLGRARDVAAGRRRWGRRRMTRWTARARRASDAATARPRRGLRVSSWYRCAPPLYGNINMYYCD